MPRPRVMIIGGGLAGLAAAMKLAELEMRRRRDEPPARQPFAQLLRPGRHQQRQRASRGSSATTNGSTSKTPSTAAISCSTSRR